MKGTKTLPTWMTNGHMRGCGEGAAGRVPGAQFVVGLFVAWAMESVSVVQVRPALRLPSLGGPSGAWRPIDALDIIEGTRRASGCAWSSQHRCGLALICAPAHQCIAGVERVAGCDHHDRNPVRLLGGRRYLAVED